MGIKPTLPSLSEMLGNPNCIHCGKKIGTCQCKDYFRTDKRVPFTKDTLIQVLQAMSCPGDTPVMFLDSEWEQTEILNVALTEHPMRRHKIIVLESD